MWHPHVANATTCLISAEFSHHCYPSRSIHLHEHIEHFLANKFVPALALIIFNTRTIKCVCVHWARHTHTQIRARKGWRAHHHLLMKRTRNLLPTWVVFICIEHEINTHTHKPYILSRGRQLPSQNWLDLHKSAYGATHQQRQSDSEWNRYHRMCYGFSSTMSHNIVAGHMIACGCVCVRRISMYTTNTPPRIAYCKSRTQLFSHFNQSRCRLISSAYRQHIARCSKQLSVHCVCTTRVSSRAHRPTWPPSSVSPPRTWTRSGCFARACLCNGALGAAHKMAPYPLCSAQLPSCLPRGGDNRYVCAQSGPSSGNLFSRNLQIVSISVWLLMLLWHRSRIGYNGLSGLCVSLYLSGFCCCVHHIHLLFVGADLAVREACYTHLATALGYDCCSAVVRRLYVCVCACVSANVYIGRHRHRYIHTLTHSLTDSLARSRLHRTHTILRKSTEQSKADTQIELTIFQFWSLRVWVPFVYRVQCVCCALLLFSLSLARSAQVLFIFVVVWLAGSSCVRLPHIQFVIVVAAAAVPTLTVAAAAAVTKSTTDKHTHSRCCTSWPWFVCGHRLCDFRVFISNQLP